MWEFLEQASIFNSTTINNSFIIFISIIMNVNHIYNTIKTFIILENFFIFEISVSSISLESSFLLQLFPWGSFWVFKKMSLSPVMYFERSLSTHQRSSLSCVFRVVRHSSLKVLYFQSFFYFLMSFDLSKISINLQLLALCPRLWQLKHSKFLSCRGVKEL